MRYLDDVCTPILRFGAGTRAGRVMGEDCIA